MMHQGLVAPNCSITWPPERLADGSVPALNTSPGPHPQVRIAPNWMSGSNQQVRARQLWGSDVYTEDSDLVAALLHCGFFYNSPNACPPTVSPCSMMRIRHMYA